MKNSRAAEKEVTTLISEILKSPVTSESTKKNTPNWDSLKQVEIIFCLEEKFNIQLSEEEMLNLDSVKKIIQLVSN